MTTKTMTATYFVVSHVILIRSSSVHIYKDSNKSNTLIYRCRLVPREGAFYAQVNSYGNDTNVATTSLHFQGTLM